MKKIMNGILVVCILSSQSILAADKEAGMASHSKRMSPVDKVDSIAKSLIALVVPKAEQAAVLAKLVSDPTQTIDDILVRIQRIHEAERTAHYLFHALALDVNTARRSFDLDPDTARSYQFEAVRSLEGPDLYHHAKKGLDEIVAERLAPVKAPEASGADKITAAGSSVLKDAARRVVDAARGCAGGGAAGGAGGSAAGARLK